MSIVRYDPFRELDRLQSEMNRLFEGVLTPTGERSATSTTPARLWAPAVDVAETPGDIVLRAELPGMKQEDIDIELSGDTLTLRGERKYENEERKDSFVRVERSYGRFQRSFTLAVPVNVEQVKATYRDGILEIYLPKSEASKPRKVQVVSVNGNTAKSESEPSAVATGEASPS